MSPKTKKHLLIAGGIAGGAAVLFGAIVLFSGSAKADQKQNEQGAVAIASDADINAVAQKALTVETDPVLIRALATAMLVIPPSDPLRNYVGQLQARAASLEAIKTNAGQQETFQHIKQF